MSRYLFLQARFWLYPQAASSLVVQGRRPAINASAFARVLHIFRLCQGYSTIADFLVKALQISRDTDILDVVMDTVRRDADVWTAMDRWEVLTDALMERNASQDAQGQHHPPLSALLVELGQRNRLSPDDLADVQASIETSRKAKPTPSAALFDGKESMDAVRLAISNGDVGAASSLGSKLFSRHGPFENWSTLWWQTVVDAIGDAAAATSHITAVYEQADGRLDKVVDTWLGGVADPVTLMSSPNAQSLCTVLLHACASRQLRLVSGILEALVYPVWSKCSAAILKDGNAPQPAAIANSLTLCQQLLLTEPPHKSLPPTCLCQALVLQTERGETLKGSHVILLLQRLPFLVVLKLSKGTPDRTKRSITLLLEQLAETPHFKAAAFRHLDVLKDAFLSNEWSQSSMENLEAGMVDVLKMIMSQGMQSELGYDVR